MYVTAAADARGRWASSRSRSSRPTSSSSRTSGSTSRWPTRGSQVPRAWPRRRGRRPPSSSTCPRSRCRLPPAQQKRLAQMRQVMQVVEAPLAGGGAEARQDVDVAARIPRPLFGARAAAPHPHLAESIARAAEMPAPLLQTPVELERAMEARTTVAAPRDPHRPPRPRRHADPGAARPEDATIWDPLRPPRLALLLRHAARGPAAGAARPRRRRRRRAPRRRRAVAPPPAAKGHQRAARRRARVDGRALAARRRSRPPPRPTRTSTCAAGRRRRRRTRARLRAVERGDRRDRRAAAAHGAGGGLLDASGRHFVPPVLRRPQHPRVALTSL